MRRVVAVVLAALLLAACKVDTTVTLSVEPDGSGTITVTVVADADVVAKAPGLADDIRLDDVVAAGWTTDRPTPTADGGLSLTLTRPFATVEEATSVLATISGPDGPFHGVAVARLDDGTRVTTSLSGTVRVDGGVNAFADPDVLAALGGSPYADDIAATRLTAADVVTFTFTANLPGALQPMGGAPAPTALTWTVPIDSSAADVAATAIYDRGDAGGGIWSTVSTVALVALVAWCVLAIAFIAFVMVARKRKAQRRAAARPTLPRR